MTVALRAKRNLDQSAAFQLFWESKYQFRTQFEQYPYAAHRISRHQLKSQTGLTFFPIESEGGTYVESASSSIDKRMHDPHRPFSRSERKMDTMGSNHSIPKTPVLWGCLHQKPRNPLDSSPYIYRTQAQVALKYGRSVGVDDSNEM